MKQTLQEPLTEAAKIIFSPDKSVPAVQLQAECFAIAVALYCHFDHIPWPQIQDAVLLSYAVKDLPATKDALDILQGNYSPSVVGDPSFLQEVSIWAEH